MCSSQLREHSYAMVSKRTNTSVGFVLLSCFIHVHLPSAVSLGRHSYTDWDMPICVPFPPPPQPPSPVPHPITAAAGAYHLQSASKPTAAA